VTGPRLYAARAVATIASHCRDRDPDCGAPHPEKFLFRL